MATILITGGSGLIGKQLHNLLLEKKHTVFILSRTKSNKPNTFFWDINTNYIDEKAIKEIDYIIHLAGAGIAEQRWTKKRKKVLISSRVDSTKLLLKKVKEINPNLKGFIAASGIGYYGAVTNSTIYTEDAICGTDFLSTICELWENSSLEFSKIGVRTVIFRTGVVFSNKGGALKKISSPIKYGFGSSIGSGNQYIPWIHIEDLCNMYVKAIENETFNGIYNAVAPNHTTNKQLTKTIAKILFKPLWLPNVPKFVMKLLFGEMAIILLEGSRVSSKKIEKANFQFKYPTVLGALENLF